MKWVVPKEQSVSVKPDQIYELAIETEDELKLGKIVQQVRTGTEEWIDFQVPVSNQKDINPESQTENGAPNWRGLRASLQHSRILLSSKSNPTT